MSTELTKTEERVLEQILLGKRNQKIADDLHVSINTVKTHVSNILRKKNVKSRVDLIISHKSAQV